MSRKFGLKTRRTPLRRTKKHKIFCINHDWRVGAFKGAIFNHKIKKVGLWIHCYKCNEKILATY